MNQKIKRIVLVLASACAIVSPASAASFSRSLTSNYSDSASYNCTTTAATTVSVSAYAGTAFGDNMSVVSSSVSRNGSGVISVLAAISSWDPEVGPSSASDSTVAAAGNFVLDFDIWQGPGGAYCYASASLTW